MNFSSDNSLFWLIPWGVVSVLLALWLYRGKSAWLKDLAPRWKRLLIGLRAIGLFLLGVLFIGIIFQAFSYRTERPLLIVGVDTSSSMLNYSDSSSVKRNVEALLTGVDEELTEKFEVVRFEFASELKPWKKNAFYQGQTDLSASIEQVRNDYYNRNVGGILMISDGNFNTGSNPIYAAEKLTLVPFYTLGVGDTIPKRDHFIKNIAVNEVAFLKNQFPVVVDIEGVKMGKTATSVTIEHSGAVVARQQIQYTDGVSDFQQLTFMLDASSPGFQQYTVRIDRKENEYNYENNARTFYIEVIDSRSKVVILSDAPHPDITAMKSVWDADANLEVEFNLLSEWKRDLKNVDLIVWHEAGRARNDELRSFIMNTTVSKLFVIGPNSDRAGVNGLGIGLTIPGGFQTDDVEGSINPGFQEFEVSEDLKKAVAYYPPLKAHFGKMTTPGGINVLTYQRIGPVVKKEPQLFFGTAQNAKYGVIYGEGIWKWRLTEYARSQSFRAFNELFSKIGQYLMVKQNSEPLRVTLPKRFSTDQPVIINATVLNASLEPITSETVQFVLTDENGKESKLQFGAMTSNYRLDLGRLKAGKYSWTASTQVAGKRHSKTGVFVVEDRNVENLDTRANHTVLNQIAQKSGGRFRELKDYKKSIEELKNREDLTTISYQDSSFNDLIDYWWIAFLLLLVFGTEWFFRRWLGAY